MGFIGYSKFLLSISFIVACWCVLSNPTRHHTANVMLNVKKKDMIRLTLLFSFSIILLTKLFSQPDLNWQKCYGGTQGEQFSEIKLTNSNEIIFAGSTSSNDGDVVGLHGESDYWIGKIDANGTLLWQKCLGGSKWDYGNALDYCSDGGLIVAGQTDSDDGDISNFIGYVDFWVVKTDQLGNIQWENCYGGTSPDQAYSVKETNDNGFIIAGRTQSNDHHVSGNHGEDDSWVLKVDSLGNIEWQKCLGGSAEDWANDVCITTNGYYVLSYSESNDGDVTGNHGDHDYWIVKLDLSGNIVWQRSLGGSDLDQGNSIQATSDGGCIATGRTFSNDGDISSNTGEEDYWVVKLDSSGNLEWEKCYGFDFGNYNDDGQSICQTIDGGFLVSGYSFGMNTCFLDWDFWIIKITAEGEQEWAKCIGGNNKDYAYSVIQDSYGNIYIGGNTRSNDGDVSENHGWVDSWLVKLGDFANIEMKDIFPTSSVFPNPSYTNVTIIMNNDNIGQQDLYIYDNIGRLIKSLKCNNLERIIVDVSEFRKGLYFYKFKDYTTLSGKFIVK